MQWRAWFGGILFFQGLLGLHDFFDPHGWWDSVAAPVFLAAALWQWWLLRGEKRQS